MAVRFLIGTALFATILIVRSDSVVAVSAGSFERGDPGGTVGKYASLVLDSAGNPVVAYYNGDEATYGDFRLMHCNDPNCAGNDESIEAPDLDPPPIGDDGSNQGVGLYVSLRLDGSGYPVVAYHEHDRGYLKVLHCNDPNCTGNNESINFVDGGSPPDVYGLGGHAGSWLAMVLDGAGRPVVSYREGIINPGNDGNLRILHCNDVNCSGNNESIVPIADGDHDVANYQTALALDASERPVVGYFDDTADALNVLHCDDTNCAGNESANVRTFGAPNMQGFPSLLLDASGFPVVTVGANGNLRLLRCNDVNCDGGGDVVSVIEVAFCCQKYGGYFTSLALDGDLPVVTHNNAGVTQVRVIRCGIRPAVQAI